jgi:hypothetical protein
MLPPLKHERVKSTNSREIRRKGIHQIQLALNPTSLARCCSSTHKRTIKGRSDLLLLLVHIPSVNVFRPKSPFLIFMVRFSAGLSSPPFSPAGLNACTHVHTAISRPPSKHYFCFRFRVSALILQPSAKWHLGRLALSPGLAAICCLVPNACSLLMPRSFVQVNGSWRICNGYCVNTITGKSSHQHINTLVHWFEV